MKNILLVASEVAPFIKTGGLADVAGSLPKYYNKEEYDVRVMLPKYLCMAEKYTSQMEKVTDFMVQLNWRTQYAGIYQIKQDGVTYYFVDNEYYFAGGQPYGDIYQDVEKFSFFCKAVLSSFPYIDFYPNIIHGNDWQTGLLPAMLKDHYKDDEKYKYIKTVFSIHNMKFQGRWYCDAVRDAAGLPAEYFTMDTMEAYGNANLLKGGIVFSDRVTTVSETYAKEIQGYDGGEGLDGLMRFKDNVLSGIVNGIDYDEFNPATDKYLDVKYEGDIKKFKAENKKILQESYGLNVNPDSFLIGIVSRLTEQKGFDLVDCLLDEIMQDDRIQLIVLGTGEEKFENAFRHFSGKYWGRVSANIYYSEELAHLIYAGCDAFLMPSQFEPCGLSQLISMRYGTLPLVRETGGLKDTVQPYNEFEGTGNGFSFHNFNAHEMMYMIRYACKIYFGYRQDWDGIVERALAGDYSWDTSARKYEALYEELLAEAEQDRINEKRAYADYLIRKEEEARLIAEEKALREKEAAEAAEKAAKEAEEKAKKEAEKKSKKAAKKAEPKTEKKSAAKKTTKKAEKEEKVEEKTAKKTTKTTKKTDKEETVEKAVKKASKTTKKTTKE